MHAHEQDKCFFSFFSSSCIDIHSQHPLFLLILSHDNRDLKTKKKAALLQLKAANVEIYMSNNSRAPCPLCDRWSLCKQLLEKHMAPLNRCKERWWLDPTRGPGREGTGDNVCQQTLTGLYHNELSVSEELKG